MKKTVLYDAHIKNGGKMVEYAGYLMPVEYVGLSAEHMAVRQSCGLFDVSHMGEIFVLGADAKRFVNYVMTNRVDAPLRMTYGLFLYPNGGIVDDLMAYCFSDEKIMLVVNASNVDKDFAWLQQQTAGFDIELSNQSNYFSQLAFQGKKAVDVLQTLTNYDLQQMHMFDFDTIDIINRRFITSRSGYTGEDGFEIYGAGEDIVALFDALVALQVPLCGLGARDTLRFEANLPLYGHEIDANINPLEATLRFAIDFSKDFIGKDALLLYENEGLKRKVVALELLERGIARQNYEVVCDDKIIGHITTGYMVPGKQSALALAMLDVGYWDIGQEVFVRIRQKDVKAKIRNKKFLNKKYIK